MVWSIRLQGANRLDYDEIHHQNEDEGKSVESVNARVIVPRVEGGGEGGVHAEESEDQGQHGHGDADQPRGRDSSVERPVSHQPTAGVPGRDE